MKTALFVMENHLVISKITISAWDLHDDLRIYHVVITHFLSHAICLFLELNLNISDFMSVTFFTSKLISFSYYMSQIDCPRKKTLLFHRYFLEKYQNQQKF